MYLFKILRSVGLENIDSWETTTKIKTIQYQSPRSLLIFCVLSLTYILKQTLMMLEKCFCPVFLPQYLPETTTMLCFLSEAN